MSATGLGDAGGASRLVQLYGELRRREPTLAALAVLMAAASVLTLVAMAVDTRTFNGISVWLKPFKFQTSTALYLVTLTWFWPYLDAEIRSRRSVRLGVWAISAVFVFEIGYITFRAALAQASHFNQSSVTAAALYILMGVAILGLVCLGAWLGALILRSSQGAVAPTLRLAVGAGLIAGNVLGGLSGMYLSAQSGHWVGGTLDDTTGLPFLGWSRTGGDLRVAHFVGLHAMQGVPIIGYVVQHWPGGRAIVWTSLALWLLATVAVFVQAVRGMPLLPL